MKYALLPVIALLAACGQSPDGYEFEHHEFERPAQYVTVVEHDTLESLREEAPAEAVDDERDLHGFSYVGPSSCEIHVASLQSSDARMWLGHEMTHCVYGRWHD